jgi:hypothetical protein
MKKKVKDKNREKSGALFFFAAGLPLSAFAAALFSFASFFIFIPYLNLASASILSPAVCSVLCLLLLRRTRLEPIPARVLAAAVSLSAAYVFICVTTGVLSGLFGAFPYDAEEMRFTGIMEYLGSARVIFSNSAYYLVYPDYLWQDITAWSGGGWHMIAACSLISHAVLPQIFIKRREHPYAA